MGIRSPRAGDVTATAMITIKTYPNPSDTYGETVCVAGVMTRSRTAGVDPAVSGQASHRGLQQAVQEVLAAQSGFESLWGPLHLRRWARCAAGHDVHQRRHPGTRAGRQP